MGREMFSTNLIQSNYGDLNIKSLAFDSFKERLESTMAALFSGQNSQVKSIPTKFSLISLIRNSLP